MAEAEELVEPCRFEIYKCPFYLAKVPLVKPSSFAVKEEVFPLIKHERQQGLGTLASLHGTFLKTMTRSGDAMRVFALITFTCFWPLLGACQRPDPDLSGSQPDQPDTEDRSKNDTSAPVEQCKATLEEVANLNPKSRAFIIRGKCAGLLTEPSCGKAVEALKQDPVAEEVVGAVKACTSAYCSKLRHRPPLCDASLDASTLDRTIIYEWTRFAGEAMVKRGSVPLSWSRIVSLNMTFDWLPITAPSGPEPTKRLNASIKRHGDGASRLIISDEGGQEIGRWTFADVEAGDEVERALDSVESKVRLSLVHLAADRNTHGKTVVRVRTGLLVLGARPITPMN